MKPKNFKKKLSLRKTTIADLEKIKMNIVKAGAAVGTETGETCMFCDTYWSCVPNRCLWKQSCPICP
jgi:hypothetical protein